MLPTEATSSSSAAPAPLQKIAVAANAMGTHLNFVAVTSTRVTESETRAALAEAIATVQRLEGLMTTWRDDSEVSHINQSAGRAPVRVSAETLAVIDKSLWVSQKSEGVFDITFEAMHGLWKFDEDLDRHLPSPAAVELRRKLIDYRHVVLDRSASTVFIDQGGMKMSLGGIAKGYAIDRASAVLLAAGIDNFLVQAGGDLYVHGRRIDGTPWIAGVRDPRGEEGDHFAVMPVRDHAFSTAGDYERAYVVDGKRYHHIIDPRTGYPATRSRSVTIWAHDALTADALDDAVFILGPQKGLALVESLDDVGAIIVDSENHVWVSKRLESQVRIERPPSDGI